ncbi:MAG TPA: hypothetical protein VFB23_12830 [Candidatus Acidoferrales bacterium]|nr:hypothetical protein [Candidatus Acidoferrales bacterium]
MLSARARLPKLLFFATAAGAWLYFLHDYPQLPRVIASHFDQHGFANGWQTKQSFFGTFAGMTALGAFLVFALPTTVSVLPARWINLPHKDYWLGPEQRAASLRFLSAWFAWFGCAVYFVIVIAFDFAVETNLRPLHQPNIARLWYTLAFLIGFTIIWTRRLFARFGRVPRTPSD